MSTDEELHTKQGRAPEEEINPSEIGPGDLNEPDEDDEDDGGEVGGRAVVKFAMKCYKCSGVTWIDYNTEDYKAYHCARCDAVNVL